MFPNITRSLVGSFEYAYPFPPPLSCHHCRVRVRCWRISLLRNFLKIPCTFFFPFPRCGEEFFWLCSALSRAVWCRLLQVWQACGHRNRFEPTCGKCWAKIVLCSRTTRVCVCVPPLFLFCLACCTNVEASQTLTQCVLFVCVFFFFFFFPCFTNWREEGTHFENLFRESLGHADASIREVALC